MIETERDAEEFVERIGEFVEPDGFHRLTTGENRERLTLHYRLSNGRLSRTNVFIYEDGTWTREFASERGWRWSVGEEREVFDPVDFIWSKRRAVNEFLMLNFPGSLEQRVYGVGA